MIRVNSRYHPLGHCPPRSREAVDATPLQRSRLFPIIRNLIDETVARLRGPWVQPISQKHPDFWRERCADCWEQIGACRCQRGEE